MNNIRTPVLNRLKDFFLTRAIHFKLRQLSTYKLVWKITFEPFSIKDFQATVLNTFCKNLQNRLFEKFLVDYMNKKIKCTFSYIITDTQWHEKHSTISLSTSSFLYCNSGCVQYCVHLLKHPIASVLNCCVFNIKPLEQKIL